MKPVPPHILAGLSQLLPEDIAYLLSSGLLKLKLKPKEPTAPVPVESSPGPVPSTDEDAAALVGPGSNVRFTMQDSYTGKTIHAGSAHLSFPKEPSLPDSAEASNIEAALRKCTDRKKEGRAAWRRARPYKRRRIP